MDLKAKTKVTLGQDPDSPENWYWFKDANGFELRAGYKDVGVIFNHRELSKTFLEAIGKETSKTQNFKIAGQHTTVKGDKTLYWGILI